MGQSGVGLAAAVCRAIVGVLAFVVGEPSSAYQFMAITASTSEGAVTLATWPCADAPEGEKSWQLAGRMGADGEPVWACWEMLPNGSVVIHYFNPDRAVTVPEADLKFEMLEIDGPSERPQFVRPVNGPEYQPRSQRT